jgi:cyclopropane-fatty-acyl-phospholipid synthase
MNRSRLDPLGVPGSDYNYRGSYEQPSNGNEPNGLDRWIVQQIMSKLDASRVRIVLWDAPAKAPSDEPVTVRIADRKALFKLVTYPELHFGDLYSAGRLTVQGDLLTVLEEAYRYVNENKTPGSVFSKGPRLAAPSLSESRRNIHHHYDIGNEFYNLWLDREALQYTCAYYAEEDMTIEQAQQAKMHHVCRKLRLRADEDVVEAGGGWGGFALFMAKNYGVKVRSYNISKEQIAYSRAWAEREGLSDRVEFVEDDFRTITGRYDAFVSIGMLEHAGAGNYKALGGLMSNVLTPNGRGLVHSIGRDRAEKLNPWIDKRIFPGAYPPTLREMMDLFEPNDLSVLDVENIRPHYAKTLQAWLDRYEENVEAVRAMFDEPFVRAWRLYLAGSITGFLWGKLQLFQVLFARSGSNDVPWTRAHIYKTGD